MARRRTIKKREARKIARERVDILFNQSRGVFSSDPVLARRYVTLARAVAMRYNVRLTKKDKVEICRRCNSFLVPGVNSRVRTHDLRVVITCLECGSVRRVPFVRERKGKLNKCAKERSLNQIKVN